MSDLYQQVLLEELESPQNKGVMEYPDVVFHEVNTSCGDDMTVYLRFDGKMVADISWVGSGCAISQATMSLLSEEIKGKSLSNIAAIGKHDLEKLIGITEISTGRIKCLLLGLSAINKAISQKL